MPDESPSALELTQQLIAHARADGRDSSASDVDAAAAALHLMSGELARWMGPSGGHALLTRALLQAGAGHPALRDLRIEMGPEPQLDRFAETVDAHGARDVAAGLEAALVILFGLLTRLIGDDLSMRIVELTIKPEASAAAPSDDERAAQR